MSYLGSGDDTIVALATASGVGALALIRLSGKDAIKLTDRVFKGKDLTKQASHTIHFGAIEHQGKMIDEVLVSIFIAPRSYTGENAVEISCHASPYIVQAIITLLIQQGAGQAKPGEFTLRAFLNGRLDLSQAESVSDLIAARSEASHRIALQQLKGGISNRLKELRMQLIDFSALLELEMDFSEEDVEFADRERLKTLLRNIQQEIHRLMTSFERGNALKTGIPVVIAGNPNVGKSTLLNTLLDEEKAIVSDIPGTTRDSIEDTLFIGEVCFRFIDTAGIRITDDEIEKMGVQKAYDKIRRSALAIYLFDPQETSPIVLKERLEDLSQYIGPQNMIPVGNKVDRLNMEDTCQRYSEFQDIVFISAKNKQNIESLTNVLQKKTGIDTLREDEPTISNIRHFTALHQANEAIEEVFSLLEQGKQEDLAAFEIKRALCFLGEITGQVSNDDLLDSIFTRFCIGK